VRDDRASLVEIRRIVEDAMRPDSRATVNQLLADLSGPLTAAGLDPLGDIDCDGVDAGAPICRDGG
jgi:hypothetical protein